MFGLFKKKDPVCGMKEKEGTGIKKDNEWFCSNDCLKKYEKQTKDNTSHDKKGCCH